MEVPISPLTPTSISDPPAKSILIDALFGYGLLHTLDKSWKPLLQQINVSTNPVLAVDIPQITRPSA